MLACLPRTHRGSLTIEPHARTVVRGASNTGHRRSRPVSAVFLCPHVVGSPAEYNSLAANRRGLIYDRLLAPGTRAHGRRTGAGQRVA